MNNPLFWIICPSFYFTEISGLNLKFLVICTNRIYLVYMNNYTVAGLRKNVTCDAQLSSVFSLICWKMAQQHRDRGRATAYVIGSALCVLSPHSPTSTSTIFTFISKYWNDTERSGGGGKDRVKQGLLKNWPRVTGPMGCSNLLASWRRIWHN